MRKLYLTLKEHIKDHNPNWYMFFKFIKIFIIIFAFLCIFLFIVDTYYNYFNLFERDHTTNTYIQKSEPSTTSAINFTTNGTFENKLSLLPQINLSAQYLNHESTPHIMTENSNRDNPVEAFNAASMVALTSALIAVAWIQLDKIKEVGRADFLMRIENKYSSSEILEARSLILDIRAEIQSNNQNAHSDILTKILGERIKDKFKGKMLHSLSYKTSKSISDEMKILNLLNFLETISFFANKQQIHYREVHELLGGSIIYYHKIFTPLINYMREESGDDASKPYQYCELNRLVKNIAIHQKQIESNS